MKRQYDAFTDEELIEQLRDGDSAVMDFLMEKYKYLVRKKANAVFLLGGDTDDLVQEGMIGLFKAVRSFYWLYRVGRVCRVFSVWSV